MIDAKLTPNCPVVFQTPSGISYGAISKLPCSLSLRLQWFLPLTQSCFRSEVLAVFAACPCGSWFFGFVFLLSHPKHLGVKRWSRCLCLSFKTLHALLLFLQNLFPSSPTFNVLIPISTTEDFSFWFSLSLRLLLCHP